jgi:hypothetical protein
MGQQMTTKAFDQGQSLANAIPQPRLIRQLFKVLTIMTVDLAQDFRFASLAGQVHQHIDLQDALITILFLGTRSQRCLHLVAELGDDRKH